MTVPRLLSIDAAARATHGLVSRSRIHEAIRTGELPSSRPARRRIIRAIDLASWLGVDVADLATNEDSKPPSAA